MLLVAVGLLIGACDAAPASGPTGPPTPLTVGDRTVKLISLGGQRTDELLTRIAAGMAAAVAAVEAFWGTDWSPEIVVVATGTDAQFAADAHPARAADTAAVAVADSTDSGRRFAVGQRIVFAPGAAAMSAGALRIVLGHELFHYAARADTAIDAPRWLTEGVADFVARPVTAVPAAPVLPARLPSDADLDSSGWQRSLAYDQAWWFARFIADAYGVANLRGLYLAACGAGHADPPTAVRQVLDTDLPGLLARWQQWLSR